MTPETKIDWPSLPTRERDALVAEKVMGWKDVNKRGFSALVGIPQTSSGLHHRIPDFSTSIADAFKVVEQFEFMDINKEGEEYSVTINQDWSISGPEAGFGRTDFARSKSLPEALSLAALRAKGVEV